MTERKQRALTDLRPVAEKTLFADLRVTPELKAKLRRRIELASAPAPAPKRSLTRSPWLRWGGAAGIAAAAVMALVMIGQQPELQKAATPVANPVADEVKPQTTDSGRFQGTLTPGAPPSVNGQVITRSDVQAITVTAKDAYGNGVTTPPVKVLTAPVVSLTAAEGTSNVTFTVQDQNGAAVQVAGVEAQPGRKIVLNAEYELQVTDAVTAMQRLQNLAATTAGYVVDAQLIKGGDGSWFGRLTLRLPSGQYNGAVQEIRRIGEVRQERQWSQDVTERYYDLEARIRIQEEYERKLQELAGKAATFDDWMKLTRQINDTRALIEQMQGSLKLLVNQVEYSTINLTFSQPAPGKEPPPKPPEPAKGLWPSMARAFQASVQWFAQLGQALLVGAAASAPFLVALLLLGVLGLVAWRRLRKPTA